MWLVVEDWCGLGCAIGTYLIVIVVYCGFIRIGIWEQLVEGESIAYLHLFIFQTSCFMIYWTHWKCMTTQPGVLPKVQQVQFSKLPL